MKKSITLFLAIIMLLALVGCNNAASEKPATTTQAQAGQSATIRTDLNLTLNQAIVSLNPYESTALIDIQLYNQIYETLFFVSDSGELIPRIADSYTVEADNQTYLVKLHKGIKFHNGKEVTAEDVAWSIDYGFVTVPTWRPGAWWATWKAQRGG